MKNILTLLMTTSLLLSVISCDSPPPATEEPEEEPQEQTTPEPTPRTDIKHFLITEEGDTAYFPTLLTLDKDYRFTSDTSPIGLYDLSIKRIDGNQIEYYLTKDGKKVLGGTASLGEYFYLGAESDFDEDGVNYFVDEYFSDTDDDCSVRIRIQADTGERLRFLAKGCAAMNDDDAEYFFSAVK
jgi:hypothetical protein